VISGSRPTFNLERSATGLNALKDAGNN